MKRVAIVTGIIVAIIISCEKEVIDLCEDGQIIGRDYSRWACGGGWKLRTARGDTLLVHFASRFKRELSAIQEDQYPVNVCYKLKPLNEMDYCSEFATDLSHLDFVK